MSSLAPGIATEKYLQALKFPIWAPVVREGG